MSFDNIQIGFQLVSNQDLGGYSVARGDQIKGGFKTFRTFNDLNSTTGSDAFAPSRQYQFSDGQLLYVSESNEFYRVVKFPTGLTLSEVETIANDLEQSVQDAIDEWTDGTDLTYEKIIFPSSSTSITASYIDPTFISASAAAEGFGSGGSGDPIDLTALNNHTGSINTFTGSIQTQVDNLTVVTGSYVTTSSFNELSGSFLSFTSSFTDKGDDGQVRITIDAIPSESIFNFRENGSDLFGTKATGSITVDAGFGTNDKDTFFIDCQTDFVVRIQNFTNTSQFNSSVPNLYNIGGVYNAQSTEQFLLTASAIINDNDDLGTINISGIEVAPDNAPIAGFLSSSVSGNTINFVAKHIGTFANNIRVAFTGSDVATSDAYLVPSSQVKQLGGGNNHNSDDIIANGTSIGNIAVLDISGSGDTNASLKRMDLLSFLDETSVLNINSKIDTLISQSNSRYYATNASKLDVGDGNGIIGSADLLIFLGAYGQKANGAALPAPGTGTVPGERVAGSDTREGLREAGGVTDQQDSVLTNGTFTIANQSSGSLNIEGTDLISLPAKIDFTDKIGGVPGNSGSGVFQSSGSLLFHSESIGSFEFNRPLDIQGNLSSSGELIGIINGGSF